VFILEHYISSKSFAAVHEAFSSAHSDKEVPNTATIYRLIKFNVQAAFVCLRGGGGHLQQSCSVSSS
jgi:hypothetical protein